MNISDVLELLGRHEEAAEAAREGIALADRVGLARTLGAFLTGNLAESLLRLGRWSEAEQLATRALNALPEGVFAATVLQLRAELAAMTGRYAGRRRRRACRPAGPRPDADEQFALTLLYADALVALGQGDPAAARRAHRGRAGGLRLPMSGRYIWPVLWLAARTEADEATRARDRREGSRTVPRPGSRPGVARRAMATPSVSSRGYRALVTAELARAVGEADARVAYGRGLVGGRPGVAGGGRALPAGVHPAAPGRGRRGGG